MDHGLRAVSGDGPGWVQPCLDLLLAAEAMMLEHHDLAGAAHTSMAIDMLLLDHGMPERVVDESAWFGQPDRLAS